MTALYEKVNQTQSWTNMMYPQWQGDDITANPGSNKQACAELDAFSAANNNKGVTAAWSNHYAVIKAATSPAHGKPMRLRHMFIFSADQRPSALLECIVFHHLHAYSGVEATV